ncbi:MAG: glycosyltransferase family 2 protein [Pedobacter sp.]|nr:MAG: glycosyltransferase family 2 protein [Pedobacter sp.]
MFKISVIIPVYNSEETILTCLESVLAQTYSVMEIIIINDGSTDNTLSVLQNFIDSCGFKNIVLLNKVNSGPSASRNLGVRTAKGDWVAFLDSDDFWHHKKMEIQVQNILATGVGFCGTAYHKRISDPNESWLIDFRTLCKRNYFSTPTVLVKRKIIENISFDETQKHSEDYMVWLLISCEHECLYINEVLSDNISQKRLFGDKGLSANLWKMELGELKNYKALYSRKLISTSQFLLYSGFSFMKYLRRVVITQTSKE